MLTPRVSIGLPVRNGASELEACLDCLTRQTFGDFEILVFDNASTDRTREIVEKAMQADPRIRYVRHEQDIGAGANFTAVLHAARAPYFMWRAYDDLSDLNYIESLVAALDGHPNAGLAAPNVETVRTQAGCRRSRPAPDQEPSHGDPSRQRRMIRNLQAGWVYGLYRRELLIDIKRFVDREFHFIWAVDFIMLVAMVLKSEIVGAPDTTLRLQLTDAQKQYSSSERIAERVALARNYWEVLERLLAERRASALQRLLFRATFIWHMQRRVAKWPILIRTLLSRPPA